jgi:AAA+ ATPase superfamily predicted ATPase
MADKAQELKDALGAVYTPGKPIADPALFSGRDQLLADLRAGLPDTGLHVVLYGERGVGKSSLWRILLHDRKVQVHTASASDDFVSIFLRVLEQLGEQFTEAERERLSEVSSSIGKDGVASIGSKVGEEITEKPIAERTLDLNLVLDRLARSAESLDAVVIDEFQNISRHAVQSQIIEVVKGFSDHGVNIKIFLVGVADSDDELIQTPDYPQYKGRNFVAKRVPRMSDDEVREILNRREERYRVRFEDEVRVLIVHIASGYPVTAHQLALAASREWVNRSFEPSALLTASLTGDPSRRPCPRCGIRSADISW